MNKYQRWRIESRLQIKIKRKEENRSKSCLNFLPPNWTCGTYRWRGRRLWGEVPPCPPESKDVDGVIRIVDLRVERNFEQEAVNRFKDYRCSMKTNRIL